MTVDDYMRIWKEARSTPDPLVEAWREYIDQKWPRKVRTNG